MRLRRCQLEEESAHPPRRTMQQLERERMLLLESKTSAIQLESVPSRLLHLAVDHRLLALVPLDHLHLVPPPALLSRPGCVSSGPTATGRCSAAHTDRVRMGETG